MNEIFHQFKATEFSASLEFIPVRIFYSHRDRQTNMFIIRSSPTTSENGLKTPNIHNTQQGCTASNDNHYGAAINGRGYSLFNMTIKTLIMHLL